MFFTDQQFAKSRIEKMVFHLVGPEDRHFVRLQAIEPGEFSKFFIERLRSVNMGAPYEFSDASATRERLNRIDEDLSKFQAESENLALDFQRGHGGSAAAGAFLVFVLRTAKDRHFALLKYDDETVLSYDFEEDKDGKRVVSLDTIERTFVQNADALQKSALIRLKKGGGEVVVMDRQNAPKVARYFERFLDASRIYDDANLTKKLVEITRKLIKDNPADVPGEVLKNLTQRTFDAASSGTAIQPDNQKSFLDTIFGQGLPADHPILPKFRNALRSARIENSPIQLDAGLVRKPQSVRYRTQNNIQVRVPSDMQRAVTVSENQIIIRDRVVEMMDDPKPSV